MTQVTDEPGHGLHRQSAVMSRVIGDSRGSCRRRVWPISAHSRCRTTTIQRRVGLKGYVTNLDINVMPAAEVIAKYHDLWHVERSFPMSKSRPSRPADVSPHPRRHRSAPVTIEFTALAVANSIQDRTGLAIAKVIKQLRPLRSAIYPRTPHPASATQLLAPTPRRRLSRWIAAAGARSTVTPVEPKLLLLNWTLTILRRHCVCR
jgi:hypothetical protein